MNETAMQTHMLTAHVYNEISCMFCDLRGVSVEEMTIHINSVHCSDDHSDDTASHDGLLQHTNREQPDSKSQSKSVQKTQFPVTSMHHDHQSSMHSVAEGSQTCKADASSMLFTSNHNVQTGSQHEFSRESSGNICKINKGRQQKRRGAMVGANGNHDLETSNSPPVCVSSSDSTDITTNCYTSLRSSSTSQSLPKTTVADGMDNSDRFVACICLYCCCKLLDHIKKQKSG